MGSQIKINRVPIYWLSTNHAVSIMQLISNAPPMQPLFGLLKPCEQQAYSVIVFLPNLASPYAREAAIRLNTWIAPLDELDTQLISITMTPSALARDAIPRLLLKFPIVCDPEGVLFKHFSIMPGSAWQCLPSRLPRRGVFRAMLEWRQAFRALGGVIICQSSSIIHNAKFSKIDTIPRLEPILKTIRATQK